MTPRCIISSSFIFTRKETVGIFFKNNQVIQQSKRLLLLYIHPSFSYNTKQKLHFPLIQKRNNSYISTSSVLLSPFPNDTVVLFFSNYLPESKVSAAGGRTSFILQQFLQTPGISSVHYATSTSVVPALLPPPPPPPPPPQRNDGYNNNKEQQTIADSVRNVVIINDDDNNNNNRLEQQQQQEEKQGRNNIKNYTISPDDVVVTDDSIKLQQMGVQFHSIPPNNSNTMKEFLLKTIPQTNNLIVIFDRFYSEEMYSFHIYKYCPNNSIFILDMQDMHSLRWSRQEYYFKSRKENKNKTENKNKNENKNENNNNNYNNINNTEQTTLSDPFNKIQIPVHTDDGLSNLPINVRPTVNDTNLIRELSSIHRCDVTFVCSLAEIQILMAPPYNIPKEKLILAPMFGYNRIQSPPILVPVDRCTSTVPTTVMNKNKDPTNVQKVPMDTNNNNNNTTTEFQKRKDFVFIGGFRHDPNIDAIVQLKRLWPMIRSKVQNRLMIGSSSALDCATADTTSTSDTDTDTITNTDTVNLHIYGAYCPSSLKVQLHNPKEGFYIHGYNPESVETILNNRRIMLAPIRFGAGIKGKIIDAWSNNIPVISTSIGMEGMMMIDKNNDDNNNKNSSNSNGTSSSDHQQTSSCGGGGGYIASNDEEFIHAAVELYTDPIRYKKAVNGIPILLSQLLCGNNTSWETIQQKIYNIVINKEQIRANDIYRSLFNTSTVVV